MRLHANPALPIRRFAPVTRATESFMDLSRNSPGSRRIIVGMLRNATDNTRTAETTPISNIEITVAHESDLDGILELQAANQIGKGGMLSARRPARSQTSPSCWRRLTHIRLVLPTPTYTGRYVSMRVRGDEGWRDCYPMS